MSHPLPKNASPPGNSWRSWAPGLLGVTIFSYVFAQNAWISEDAYITLRSVEQLMAGNGPRWNPHERVQVFTHPLTLLFSHGCTADIVGMVLDDNVRPHIQLEVVL